jgi:hypothetical protein
MSELPKGFVTAGHAVLFADDETARCDVCKDRVDAPEEEEGFSVRGRGLLVWTRGDERRYQEPPLCPGCAAAIGLSALQRWEIEEDEG